MEAEQCRRMAEHYLACAKQMSDRADKAVLLEMAKYGHDWPTNWRRTSQRTRRDPSATILHLPRSEP
jgi:hypothetical protein